tara:strand:- start:1433 stop:1642 length:210 start_codon:yes stop_codon:yes gene_type:complete
MSKIEFNPRKRKHIDYMHSIIMDLHNEIFNASFLIVQNKHPLMEEFREELKTKIALYKKYSRRLKILEL